MTDSSDTSRPFRFTVAPRAFSTLALTTRPHAVCTVRGEDSSDRAAGLRVCADPAGVLRFQVRPSSETDQLIKLEIHDEVSGTITRQPLELRASFEPTQDMPAPPDEDRGLVHNATVRPGLTDDETIRLSDEELLERGYPHRPNREEVPWAFRAWRRLVATPISVVEPDLVQRPELQHSKRMIQEAPSSSNNWSGFELRRSLRFGPSGLGFDEPYDWVRGRWTVPSALGENTETYSSLWVGLDGDGTVDLFQSGTETDAISYRPASTGPVIELDIATSYAWTEFLPQQQSAVQISNFPVTPGDQMLVEVWIGNAGSAPTLSGAFGVALVMNLTTGISTQVYTPVGTTRVGGSEAVWILERPTLFVPASGIFGPSTRLPDLANYGSAFVVDALARKANSPRYQGYVSYLGPRNKQISMIGASGATLSTVTSIDSSSMRFDWKAFG